MKLIHNFQLVKMKKVLGMMKDELGGVIVK